MNSGQRKTEENRGQQRGKQGKQGQALHMTLASCCFSSGLNLVAQDNVMARPLRIEFAGALYHVTARGNAQADIFDTDADRRNF